MDNFYKGPHSYYKLSFFGKSIRIFGGAHFSKENYVNKDPFSSCSKVKKFLVDYIEAKLEENKNKIGIIDIYAEINFAPENEERYLLEKFKENRLQRRIGGSNLKGDIIRDILEKYHNCFYGNKQKNLVKYCPVGFKQDNSVNARFHYIDVRFPDSPDIKASKNLNKQYFYQICLLVSYYFNCQYESIQSTIFL